MTPHVRGATATPWTLFHSQSNCHPERSPSASEASRRAQSKSLPRAKPRGSLPAPRLVWGRAPSRACPERSRRVHAAQTYRAASGNSRDASSVIEGARASPPDVAARSRGRAALQRRVTRPNDERALAPAQTASSAENPTGPKGRKALVRLRGPKGPLFHGGHEAPLCISPLPGVQRTPHVRGFTATPWTPFSTLNHDCHPERSTSASEASRRAQSKSLPRAKPRGSPTRTTARVGTGALASLP
jgi:hypothetical protein